MRDDTAIVDAWRLMVAAHDRVMKELAAELKDGYGISIAESDALLRLSLTEGHRLKMTELANMMLYSSGAATKIVDRLSDRGQVRRVHDKVDLRVVWVELTDAGLELITRARQAHRVGILRELGPFASESEERHVLAFLSRLAGFPSWP
ncbi:MarR family winged helix-turn-helix transcriptional regulator [Nocardioides sp. SR21]|uniref:MarR family winged helix-turn-helix transcriptional regulator n=1 Tax=Nocardioides sp. SR21 TaxID=2919501 RepID=UPI001FAA871C|nr:MarR family transcriptional regulator [Nocardioides sp. SR21]